MTSTKSHQQENTPQTDYERGFEFGYETAKRAFANRMDRLTYGMLPEWPEGIRDHESFNPAPEYATVVSVF